MATGEQQDTGSPCLVVPASPRLSAGVHLWPIHGDWNGSNRGDLFSTLPFGFTQGDIRIEGSGKEETLRIRSSRDRSHRSGRCSALPRRRFDTGSLDRNTDARHRPRSDWRGIFHKIFEEEP